MRFIPHISITALLLAVPPVAATIPAIAQDTSTQVLLAQAPQTGFINADSVNIRRGPGTDRAVLYVAPRGAQMRVLGQYGRGTNSWYRVQAVSNSLPRTEGWVFNQFLTMGSAPVTNYFAQGRRDGQADAQAGRTYDPVRGSRNLPANASREYTRGYAEGYQVGRPGDGNQGSLRQYYDRGYQDGLADGRAGRTYDPVRGSRNLPANASREYTRGYGDGYGAGRP